MAADAIAERILVPADSILNSELGRSSSRAAIEASSR
jgi:hypothetical protein